MQFNAALKIRSILKPLDDVTCGNDLYHFQLTAKQDRMLCYYCRSHQELSQ